MVLKLYGVPLSPSVIRVGVVLHEKNIPFEFVTVDLAKGEHKTPEFKAKNPFEQIPYIVSPYS
jgi:glutathione S-transferase